MPTGKDSESEAETQARLDALTSERTALRAEVAQLRRSLEEVQERHEEELTGIREQLVATKSEKEHAEAQYHNLLGKVNTIKSQLGERLKADAVRLSLTYSVH
jgi:predicted  nucleic acid-binding Zn-ribbon protein